MKVRDYPIWCLPSMPKRHTGGRRPNPKPRSRRSEIGTLGGKGRAAKMTEQEKRDHAMKMVEARLVKIPAMKRSKIASKAGKAGNAIRWAGHVKKPRPTTNRRGHNAREAGKKGADARWGATT